MPCHLTSGPPRPLGFPVVSWAGAAFLALLAPPAGAQLVRSTVGLPTGIHNVGHTEALAAGDVDLDGDLDVVLGNRGFSAGEQNQIWINQGGLQGGTEGTFVDETVLRLPVLLDTTLGVQLVDLDADGDLDLFATGSSATHASRFWINQGGAQGGTLGHFADETMARWLGIGGPGSSYAPGALLGGGEFLDLAGASAFADLDGDGDLDLVHAAGHDQLDFVPTRLFLNDGAGRFEELNPSGFTLAGAALVAGSPGLWCDGVQTEDTLDATGAECDITLACADVDVVDFDGDFDLDFLLGHVVGLPRAFANRLQASSLAEDLGGAPGFRDVTHRVFPTPHAIGGAHYSQAFGDLDGDGDMDLLGANWGHVGASHFDVVLVNAGDGTFGPPTTLPGTQDDDDDIALLDYDGDGDLDVYGGNYEKVTTFDTLLRNDSPGPGLAVLTDRSEDLDDVWNNSAGIAPADFDGDGDCDVLVASAYGGPQVYFENKFDVPDVTPPWVPALEAAPAREAGAAATVIRAHVLDNACPERVSGYVVTLWHEVDGGVAQGVPMSWVGGQVFRGELPGALVGLVSYWVEAADRSVNVGISGAVRYVAAPPDELGPRYCAASPNSTGLAATIGATGSTEVAAHDLTLRVSSLPSSSFGYFLVSPARGFLANPAGSQGNLCLFPPIGRYVGPGQIQNSGSGSAVQLTLDLLAHPTPTGVVAVEPGDVWHFTYWYRDANPGVATNFSDGLTICFR